MRGVLKSCGLMHPGVCAVFQDRHTTPPLRYGAGESLLSRCRVHRKRLSSAMSVLKLLSEFCVGGAPRCVHHADDLGVAVFRGTRRCALLAVRYCGSNRKISLQNAFCMAHCRLYTICMFTTPMSLHFVLTKTMFHMLPSFSSLRGSLKRSARAVQLFGRLAVLETHILRY